MGRGACAFGNHFAWKLALGAGCIALTARSGTAAIAWTVEFPDLTTFGDAAASVRNTVLAAGAEWARHLNGRASLDISVLIDAAVPRAQGRSLTSCFAYDNGVIAVWDQGAASEILRGVDPNGSAADIEIRLSPSYLNTDLWFDPDPFTRGASIPKGKTDAYSVFLHEIGHALGFNGWRDDTTGTLGTFGSRFDELTIFDGSNFYFAGKHAAQEYGGNVPLTYGNIFHLGNGSDRPGFDLRTDLMNGVVFKRGTRYEISRLDLAILTDLGLSVVYPEVPAPGALCATGALGLMALRRRR